MTRTGIYVRLSRDREGTELGVERQEADCRHLAETRGWDVVSVYSDNDTSATSGRARKGYRQLLKDLKDGRIDAIVAYSSSRLYRKIRDLQALIDLLDARGAQIATVASGAIDITTADGRMLANILASVDQAEAERIAERSGRAKAEIKRAGGWLGGGARAYGYERIKGADGKVREHRILEAEAAVLRDAKNHALAGSSLYRISVDLNARGVPTAQSGRWQPSKLRDLLTAPFHAGRYPDGTRGSWPAIFTDDEHTLLKAKFPRRKNGGSGRPPRVYPLSGLLVCSECGRKLMGSGGAYRCQPRNGGCGKVTIRAFPVDMIVNDALEARPEWWDYNPRANDREHVDAEALAELHAAEARLVELRDAFAAGDVSLEDFKVMREAITIRAGAASDRVQAVESSPSVAVAEFYEFVDTLFQRWEAYDLPPEWLAGTSEMFRAFIEKIVIKPGRRGRPRVGEDRNRERVEIEWR